MMELSTMCLCAALQSHLSCISQFLSPDAQNTQIFFSQLVISNIYILYLYSISIYLYKNISNILISVQVLRNKVKDKKTLQKT